MPCSYAKEETSLDRLTSLMAGGAELEARSHELRSIASDSELADVARELAAEAQSVPDTDTAPEAPTTA